MPWVGFYGSPLEVAQGMAEGNIHIAYKFVDVISGQACADVSMLSFRDPDSFVAGNLQNHFPAWELIALPRLILRLRFCCGSRTVLMYTIFFNLIGEKTLIRRYPASDFF